MTIDNISRKKLNELEQQIRQLLVTIRSAKLQNEPLVELLQVQARDLEKIRHEQFDEVNTEYHTY
jgi:hypothetical protein